METQRTGKVVRFQRRSCPAYSVKVFLSLLKSAMGEKKKIFLFPEKDGDGTGVNDLHEEELMT